MKTYSFYTVSNGLITGIEYAGPDEYLAQNTPENCAAIEGSHDWQCRRVDLQTGQVVPYQPPAPAADQYTTWAWDAAIERWVSSPTTAALARDVRAERDRRMLDCDWVIVSAMDTGVAVLPAWRAYRQALRNVPNQPGFPAAVVWPTAPGV